MLISCSMAYLLRSSKHESHIRSTKSLLNRLILYSLSMGMLTSACSIVNAAVWLGLPFENFSWAAAHYLTGKLYINSYLASLNTRTTFRGQHETIGSTNFIAVADGHYGLSEMHVNGLQPPKASEPMGHSESNVATTITAQGTNDIEV
ncbi:hypothetical protein HGRIS_009139 [Hohenbuehelia grisea]|uniref:DUF6534 domain-containing protein n=1 Tax=Hohenbuehelia grisea TaxID=104357 RepID=A0ABR3J0N9_9AGAR